MILFEMLNDKRHKVHLDQEKEEPVDRQVGIRDELIDLCNTMMIKNPDERPNIH